MSKPLQPLRFVPFEETQLAKVASVIDKLVMAREYQDMFRAAHSYRYPAIKGQYEALKKFNHHEVYLIKMDGTILDVFKQDIIAQQFIDEKGNSL